MNETRLKYLEAMYKHARADRQKIKEDLQRAIRLECEAASDLHRYVKENCEDKDVIEFLRAGK